MQLAIRKQDVRVSVNHFVTLATIGVLLCINSSWALDGGGERDFLPFPRVHFDNVKGAPSQLDIKEHELEASTSAFFAMNHGGLRLLGELYLSEDEFEAERLQGGWSLSEQDTAWIGRFHTPVGFWNQEYHHGSYLMASVTRPSIVEFEDDGGVLPTHLTGVFIEGNKTVGNGFWGYTFAVGYAPALTNEGLEAVNIIDFSTSDFEPALAMMLTYQPDEFGPIRLGAFYVSSTLASEVVSIKEIEQNVVGAFFYGDWIQWKITAALFSLDNKVISTTSESDSQFSSGYFQVDYMFSRKWTIFGRVKSQQV